MEVLLGLAGGVASELLDWFRIRKELHRGVPGWAKSWLYWLITATMSGFGGLLVFTYEVSGIEVSPILAFNIGASAPLILRSLTSQVPPIESGSIDKPA